MSDEDNSGQWALEEKEIEEAWRQPAFSRETIETDRWTAVYLPTPENATRELLEYAHGSAVELQHYANPAGQAYGPLYGPAEGRPQEQHVEAARLTAHVLSGKIGELAMQEAAAVEPEKVEQARKLIDQAADRDSYYDVKWRGEDFAFVRNFQIDDLAEYGLSQEQKEIFREQEIFRAPTIEALVDKVVTHFDLGREAEPPNETTRAATIEATRIRDGEETALIGPSQPVRGFLSFWDSAENFFSHASRAVDIALGAVIGFFVDEPKLAPQQVHDTLQAAGNVETLHAREVATAVAVDGEAHEFRMMVAKGEQETQILKIATEAGTNATAEATLGLDAYEPQRRKQRQTQSL
jgi:hypothetical protein